MRAIRPHLAIYLLLFLACLALAGGTGCGENQRQKTLRAAVLSVNIARDGFVEWDRTHQSAIVQGVTSKAEGQEKLEAYRKRREPVIAGFEVAYRALALAATQEDDPSLSTALAAASEIAKAVAVLTGGI